jgi:21S rRNA (GM2251-2'-O)-methyltransferase
MTVMMGIILDVEPLKTKQFKENDLLHKSRLSNHPLWLFLYHIQDPMNLGAILRCSYYFGVDKVIVTSQNRCVCSRNMSWSVKFVHK